MQSLYNNNIIIWLELSFPTTFITMQPTKVASLEVQTKLRSFCSDSHYNTNNHHLCMIAP